MPRMYQTKPNMEARHAPQPMRPTMHETHPFFPPPSSSSSPPSFLFRVPRMFMMQFHPNVATTSQPETYSQSETGVEHGLPSFA